MRSRKPWRVWLACRTRTEEMVTGLVELSRIWAGQYAASTSGTPRGGTMPYKLLLPPLGFLILRVHPLIDLSFSLLQDDWVQGLSELREHL